MALTVAQVLGVIAPSYAADSRVTVATTMAATEIAGLYPCLVGDLRTRAIAALVEHYLCRGDREQAAADGGGGGGVVIGGVTSQAAGGLSQSYGVVGSAGNGSWFSDDSLRTTPGGMEWLRIRGGLPCAQAVGWAR